MDRIDLFLSKITAIRDFNNGAIALANADMALTTLFNGFIRYLLDEWMVGEPISYQDAPAVATRIEYYLRRVEGVRSPTRDRIEDFVNGPDSDLLPILAIRWLMSDSHILVVKPYLTGEWQEFVNHYRHVLEALESDR